MNQGGVLNAIQHHVTGTLCQGLGDVNFHGAYTWILQGYTAAVIYSTNVHIFRYNTVLRDSIWNCHILRQKWQGFDHDCRTIRANYRVRGWSAPIWGDEDAMRNAGPWALMKELPCDRACGWRCKRKEELSRRGRLFWTAAVINGPHAERSPFPSLSCQTGPLPPPSLSPLSPSWCLCLWVICSRSTFIFPLFTP